MRLVNVTTLLHQERSRAGHLTIWSALPGLMTAFASESSPWCFIPKGVSRGLGRGGGLSLAAQQLLALLLVGSGVDNSGGIDVEENALSPDFPSDARTA